MVDRLAKGVEEEKTKEDCELGDKNLFLKETQKMKEKNNHKRSYESGGGLKVHTEQREMGLRAGGVVN